MASRVDELKQVPLFSGLSQRQLRRLARDVKEREYRPGVTVVRQGKMSGIGFFIVVEGTAAVIVDGKEVASRSFARELDLTGIDPPYLGNLSGIPNTATASGVIDDFRAFKRALPCDAP